MSIHHFVIEITMVKYQPRSWCPTKIVANNFNDTDWLIKHYKMSFKAQKSHCCVVNQSAFMHESYVNFTIDSSLIVYELKC